MTHLVNAKTALRGYLEAHLAPAEVKDVSRLVAQMCVAAIAEDRAKRPDMTAGLAKLADVFFNKRRA